MTKNNNKHPILVDYNGEKHILMEIICEKDDSIYFSFPRKDKYIINTIDIKKYSNKEYEEGERKLQKIEKLYEGPKISFHPRDMIVHVKSEDNNRVEDDYPILNIDPEGKVFCYLLQIIFPLDLDFFDIYNKTKHPKFLIINDADKVDISQFDLKKYNLVLEIFVHSSEYEPNESCLPRFNNRQYKYMATSQTSDKYTYTIVVSQMDSCLENGVLININTKYEDILYTMTIPDKR